MSVLQSSRFLYQCCVFSSLVVFLPFTAFAQSTPVIIDENAAGSLTVPDAGELNIVGTEDAVDDGNSTGTEKSSKTISAPTVSVDVGQNDFFDSGDLVPQGGMSRSGPVNVNPVTQPASKYVFIRKNHDQDTVAAQLVSAERAMALGRHDSALILLEALYLGNKEDPRVLMGRAVSLQKIGRFDEAMQMYEALSKIEPDDINVKINMLGLLATRYPSVALRRMLDLYERNKGEVGLAAQIAIAYAQTGDSTSALRYLGLAASMQPNNANHIFNMAIISDRAGKIKQAVSYYEKALEIDTVHGAGRTIPRDVVYERLAQIR